MTLSLDNLGGIRDPAIRRNFEIIAQQFPIVVPAGGGGGGAPSGPAGGVLGGTYPNPAFAVDMATQAELDTHTALTTTAHGGIVASTDPRLTDARAPTAHHATHEPGGTDAMAVDAAAATGSLRTLGTGAAQALPGNHASTTNARTPTAHATTHQPGGSDAMAVDAAAATGSLRTLGTAATSAASGNRGLPVGGTTGQALTKNSATDYDAGWSTISAGGGGTQVGAFLAYRNATQSIATSVGAVTFAKVAFNAEVRDISNWFDSTTNNRYTPLTAGLYRLTASVYLQAPAAGTSLVIRLYKNGAFHRQLFRFNGSTVQDIQGGGTAQVQANGTTDFFEIFVAHDAGVAKNVFGDATTPAAYTYFEGELIG